VAKSPLYGLWDVEELVVDGQVRPPLVTDADRWRRVMFTGGNRMSFQLMSDTRDRYNVAIDPKNVIVQIPQGERARPDSFISRVRQLPVPLLPTEARVQINERTGTMIITGDVEISPVVISHKGLTISTIKPEPIPTPARPVVTQKSTVALDTTKAGGAKLQELVDALEQLQVPAEDRITSVKELYRIGMLHGKLITE